MTRKRNIKQVVILRTGSILQNVGWVHRQNILINKDVIMDLRIKTYITTSWSGFCMNSMCGVPRGPMELTDFYIDNNKIDNQCKVWD